MTHSSRVDDSLESGAVACWGGAGACADGKKKKSILRFL